jgi:hypothetical protein
MGERLIKFILPNIIYRPTARYSMARFLILSVGAATAAVLPSAIFQVQKAPTPPAGQVDVSKLNEEPQKPRCLPQRVVGIAETAEHYYGSCEQK